MQAQLAFVCVVSQHELVMAVEEREVWPVGLCLAGGDMKRVIRGDRLEWYRQRRFTAM